MTSMVKSELAAISYSSVVKQIVKISTDLQQANQRLYNIGVQMGVRVADQYKNRSSSQMSPTATIKAMLQGVSSQFMACELQNIKDDVQFGKKKIQMNLQYKLKDKVISFVILPEQLQQLNYYSLFNGFLYGALKSTSFQGQVVTIKDGIKDLSGDTIIKISVQRLIKQEDE